MYRFLILKVELSCDNLMVIAGSNKIHTNNDTVMTYWMFTLMVILFYYYRATYVARFAMNNLHIISASDDKLVRCWDLPTGKEVITYDEHTVINICLGIIFDV